MGELFLLTRGHIDHVEKWQRSMRNLFLPIKVKDVLTDTAGNKIPIEKEIPIEVQLRPYQLWGVVIPDEKFLQPMCNSLGIPNAQTIFNSTYVRPDGVKQSNNQFISGMGIKLQTEAMRLALGADKLPEQDMNKGILTTPIYRDHVSIVGIGYRPDVKIKTALGEHEAV